ncbi:MAG: hypothetical protein R3F54_14640 [Alphaproteobacteria bacterium]
MKAMPTLHDWLLYSVELGDRSVRIGFRAPEGNETRFLIAEGVEDFLCNDMREGNTVLAVDHGIEHASDDILRRLLYLGPVEESPALKRLRDQIEAGALEFVSILPSYGAAIALTAKTVAIE